MQGRGISFVLFAMLAAGCQGPTRPSTTRDEPGQLKYPPATSVAAGPVEVAHRFNDQYPTGIAVSREGRIFACYPRWESPVKFTVGEVKGDGEVAYPSAEINADDGNPEHFYAVQSVVVDPANRLWVVDTGSVEMRPVRSQNDPKLVGIDLKSNKIFKTIHFPADIALPTTYLNDVRFDLKRGKEGTAYITDSSVQGPNALIVVDLATGKSQRRLNGHASVTADKKFVAELEGEKLMLRMPGKPPMPALIGSDGIAVSADGSRVFYCPLSSRMLYSVDAAVLADETKSDSDVAATIQSTGRTFASDGLEADAQGRIYLTDWEHNAIIVRQPDGQLQTLAHDARMWWPDSLSISKDGYLYVTATQLQRRPSFHGGKDLREKPYLLLRVKINGSPVTVP